MDQVQAGDRRVVRFRPKSTTVGQFRNKQKAEMYSRDEPGLVQAEFKSSQRQAWSATDGQKQEQVAGSAENAVD